MIYWYWILIRGTLFVRLFHSRTIKRKVLGGKEGWQIVTTAQISSAAATKNTPEPDLVRWIVGVCMVYGVCIFCVSCTCRIIQYISAYKTCNPFKMSFQNQNIFVKT